MWGGGGLSLTGGVEVSFKCCSAESEQKKEDCMTEKGA